ncbi:MAG: DUF2071 domain-containing protein, partial [Kutzneria sp.]|nr:DUF2071 domain-containing protein [Kutzneria sp.]
MDIRHHPLPMRTHFTHSLVLAYALPPDRVAPLSAGLDLDTYLAPDGKRHAFVAVALVALTKLRPAFLPGRLGISSVMAGYRVLTRLPTPGGRTMRGLRILRSDTDRPLLALGANLLTGYRYHSVRARVESTADALRFVIYSGDGTADLDITADLGDRTPTPGPVFATAADARRFAGPLPYTFSPTACGRIVVVKAFRSRWR